MDMSLIHSFIQPCIHLTICCKFITVFDLLSQYTSFSLSNSRASLGLFLQGRPPWQAKDVNLAQIQQTTGPWGADKAHEVTMMYYWTETLGDLHGHKPQATHCCRGEFFSRHYERDRSVNESSPPGSTSRNWIPSWTRHKSKSREHGSENKRCSVSSIPVLQQWHVEDPGHSAKVQLAGYT